MLLFGRHKTIEKSGLLRGFTDWHSHILPGVDDGIKTMGDSLALLKRYEDVGVSTVWLTPHIMEDVPNTTARLRSRFAELRAAYKGRVALRLAAENMLDSLFAERLEAGDLLPIGEKADCLLVETSFFTPPMNLKGIMRRIMSKGYYPILAHPERYRYMGSDDYAGLREMGVRFQLNLMSYAGMYGREAKEKVRRLAAGGYGSCYGTDVHRPGQFESFLASRAEVVPLTEKDSTK